MDASEVEAQVEGFIARFEDGVAAQVRAARGSMQARLQGALELVYDNYNALAIGYGPTERQAGARLDDPQRLLKGEGSRVRHTVLDEPEQLSDPDVLALIDQALRLARTPFDPRRVGRTIIKSVSAKQRPRRPSGI